MSKTRSVEIDIEKVLKSKAPNARIPTFVVSYLRRIIHEKESNEFIRNHPELKNLDFLDAFLAHLHVSVDMEGKEKLPKGGKYIFAGNHPLGGLDGIATGYLLGKEYDGQIRFLSNDLLLNLDPLKEMFVPINKVGAQNRDNAAAIKELYESDQQLITYPAGICSRRVNGKIVDLEWKKNFISKSVEYGRDVVPIYFEGRNSTFFYTLANLRQFLGIKINLEMLYLADEMYKQKGNRFTLKIGHPIPHNTFDNSKSPKQWASWVRDIVYSMA